MHSKSTKQSYWHYKAAKPRAVRGIQLTGGGSYAHKKDWCKDLGRERVSETDLIPEHPYLPVFQQESEAVS